MCHFILLALPSPFSGLHRTFPQRLTVHGGILPPSSTRTLKFFHPSPCITRMQGWVNGINVNGSTLNSSCNIFPQTCSPFLFHNCISFLLTQLIAPRSTMRVSSVTFNSFSPAPISPQLWTSTKDHRYCPQVHCETTISSSSASCTSKWAVSACPVVPAVCIGDMNRQISQVPCPLSRCPSFL